MPSGKKAFVRFTIIFLMLVAMCVALNVYVDPYFHYHKPCKNLYYSLRPSRVRSVNDGIARNFEYSGIIIGSSMCENFKTTEAEELYGVKFVKTPYYGASLKEIDDALERALSYKTEVRVVIRGIDYNGLTASYDQMTYTDLPEYLYDDDSLNDLNYLLNFGTLLDSTQVIVSSMKNGSGITTFDEYCRFNDGYEFGKESVKKSAISVRENEETSEYVNGLDSIDYGIVEQNVRENIVDLAKEYPDVEFYYYLTPYSIYYWDNLKHNGRLESQLEYEKYAISLILECDNIKLYSFNADLDIIADLDNYTDILHHGEWINSQILQYMHEDEYRITKENYLDYCASEREALLNYDYDQLWK